MKSQKITFLWFDLTDNTTSTGEWRTMKRTISEAWDEYVAYKGSESRPGNKFDTHELSLTMTFKGHIEALDQTIALRAPTLAETKVIVAEHDTRHSAIS